MLVKDFTRNVGPYGDLSPRAIMGEATNLMPARAWALAGAAALGLVAYKTKSPTRTIAGAAAAALGLTTGYGMMLDADFGGDVWGGEVLPPGRLKFAGLALAFAAAAAYTLNKAAH